MKESMIPKGTHVMHFPEVNITITQSKLEIKNKKGDVLTSFTKKEMRQLLLFISLRYAKSEILPLHD